MPTLDADRLREVLPMLSKRQREVATMLLAGSSKRNIAHELRLNRRTVDDHISRICDRMSR